MDNSDIPIPDEDMLVTNLVVAADKAVTARFYETIGGKVIFEHEQAPTFVRLANTWVIVAEGGGGTPDKPEVTLEPPKDLNTFNAFMNLRVTDIQAKYEQWTASGVEFLTPPLDNHGFEMRCYIRDPDGRILEVGQHTGMKEIFENA